MENLTISQRCKTISKKNDLTINHIITFRGNYFKKLKPWNVYTLINEIRNSRPSESSERAIFSAMQGGTD